MFKKKFIIQKIDLYKSIILNASIFFTIIWINNLIGSNYWFTLEKPPGTNLTNILARLAWLFNSNGGYWNLILYCDL